MGRSCLGDANLDGSVNEDDYNFIDAILQANSNDPVPCDPCRSCPITQDWCPGDVNCSGQVDVNDLLVVAQRIASNPPGYPCSASAPGCDFTTGCP
jgi:hypothetical protein